MVTANKEKGIIKEDREIRGIGDELENHLEQAKSKFSGELWKSILKKQYNIK